MCHFTTVAGQAEQGGEAKLKFNKFEEKKKFQSESKKYACYFVLLLFLLLLW